VVPFSSRVTDKTGVIVGSVVSPSLEGGYVVSHKLTKVALVDVTHGAPVPGLRAVWAAGPGGDTARLHVLGSDPFAWVVPHVDVLSTTTETPGRTVQQDFGIGEAAAFADERRFGEMLVQSSGPVAQLLTDFSPALPTRVLQARQLDVRFRTWLDDPVEVEEVTFLLLSGLRQDVGLAVKPGGAQSATTVIDIYPALQLVAVTVTLSPATDALTVASTGPDPLLIYAVRYREARATTCNWQQKVVLKPGTYKLTVEGESQADYPGGGLPSSSKVTWAADETIKVAYPETLRPYIDTTTIGDSRIFDVDWPPREPAWNPTMHGFGFPIYQQYRGVVRFRVPYMNKIFPSLRFRLIYESGETVEQELVPAAAASGQNYLPDQSIRWIIDHCGSWMADQAITLTSPFIKAGPAAVRLLFTDSGGQKVKVDEWTCYVSQFDSFADHLAWPDGCVTVFYGPAGRSERSCCALVSATGMEALSRRRRIRGNRVDALVLRPDVKRAFEAPAYAGAWTEVVIGGIETHPEELSEPPVDWRLSSSLTGWLAPLDAATGTRFARFALATGDRFNGGGGGPLNGINDTVAMTTVEAVVDAAGRPYALWLRTPEPVDWRRVTATLRIKHVVGSGDCPTGYAARDPLDLTVDLLPSPDGSSAFLVGALGGIRTRLPRGIYRLTLKFDTRVANLPELKPTTAVGGPVEQVVYEFVQPGGEDWPLPSVGVVIPGYLWERLVKLYRIDWPIVEELWRPKPDPRVLEELLRARGPAGPPVRDGPDPITTVAATVARLESVTERLAALADAVPEMDVAALARELLSQLQQQRRAQEETGWPLPPERR
jgi:hypothetical protein